MNSISTYIFVHDQEIILENDINGKFKSLPYLNYVFLGYGSTDKIIGRNDVLIARDLAYNIEQYPKFCSFTGWYVLWKNNLIQSNYIHLFEYDITILNNKFNSIIENEINNKYDFIGYVPISMNIAFIAPLYLANIIPAIKKHYNIDIVEVINSFKTNNQKWSSTTNSTFSIETFNQYMTWFEKLIDDLKDHKMCGHAHERSITFFYLLYNKNVFLTKDIIKHFMLSSHRKLEKRKGRNFRRMIK